MFQQQIKTLNSRAVTLLEVIVVVVILAIGVSAAMPFLGKGLENEKMKSVQTSVRHLRDALMAYAYDHDGLLCDTGPGYSCNSSDFSHLVDAQLLGIEDLAYSKKDPDNPGIAPNYEVTYLVAGKNITGKMGNAGSVALFKVCGSFDEFTETDRRFCIYQCSKNANESTEKDTDSDECKDG